MKKILLLLVFGFTTVFAQTNKFQKIDSLLNYLYTNNKFMGSLSILEKDKIVFSRAYGLGELSGGKQLNPATKLKIGSITKTFTATMIMQLVDEKKLSLDTKLSQFYPKVVNADKITIAMLLHHRTGIPDYLNDDPTVAQYIYIENKKTDLLKRIEGYTSAFEPDSQFKYSNSNYNLLGYILEDITKKSYAENLNTRIVKKLGLKNTSFPVKIEPSQNEGYSFTYNGNAWKQTQEWHNSLAFAAGAIASTPDDLNLFLSALFNGKLVSAGSLDQMKTIKESYGKGLIIAPFDERKFYGHTGGIENFRAAAVYNVEEKTGFAVVVNGDNFNRNDLMIGVLSLFYGKDYQFPNLKGFSISETLRSKYVGTYSSKSLPIKITIAANKGELTAQATGQSSFPLTARSETEFVFETAGIQMIFGDQKMVLKQGGMEFEFIKE